MKRNFWLLVGSQLLYGDEVLKTVDARAAEMVEFLNASGKLPYDIIYKGTAKSNGEITDVVREANYDRTCGGVITWCHTFSPSKNVDKRSCFLAEAILPPCYSIQPRDTQRRD